MLKGITARCVAAAGGSKPLTRAVVFGGILMVTWLWASSASAEESVEIEAPAPTVADPSLAPVDPAVTPLADVVDDTVEAVAAPTAGVVDPVLKLVAGTARTVDTAARPLLAVAEPVAAPVVNLAKPALDTVVAPVVTPVVDRVAPALDVDSVDAPESALPEQSPLGTAALAPPVEAPAPVPAPEIERAADLAGGLRRASEMDLRSTPEMAAAPGAAAAAPQPAAPGFPQQSQRPFLATHSAPPAPSSPGGRDLADPGQHAWALAAVAHSAMPAVGVEVRPRTVGASENSGSRPAFTPD